ncbi:hypothetical protein LCG56_27495 (plasmid) [Pseudomonas cannabina pv. alisalensis]|uniref:Uncharacterized protein n=1 Tax=Pseudomonas syringae pv. maculicola str. ES4326 TaxID=629265 RepID=A0A8T8CB79_PSEYM|nr:MULTISPECIES: hypothetical protein [Pseudomonas syringae group]QHF00528.1 hypothetical protein PMA4326_028875 [Pseudomonas syringae pv. maculicola str. ES4326]UBZ00508.1 hypothetical protein LCG56_27495 [Pseudomonas cannabina pv. alisalensis]
MDTNTTRIGKAGIVITRVSALDATPTTSDVAIVIPAAELKASLWEPEVDPSPESQEPWGGWMWAFQLGNGTQALLTNDRGGFAGLFGWMRGSIRVMLSRRYSM